MTDTHTTHPDARAALDYYANRNAMDNVERTPASLFWLLDDGSREHAGDFTDLYFGLKALANVALPTSAVALGCYSTGWARPLNEDEEKAEQEKRRCALVVMCNRTFEMSAAVRIGDGDSEIDSSAGEGPIADAIALTMMLAMRTAAREHSDD